MLTLDPSLTADTPRHCHCAVQVGWIKLFTVDNYNSGIPLAHEIMV
ncbi:hypothetical protein E2C01_078489 [Portunus trituberculatus]|uniref:Uncharacterized protein n=1 Tax=Portunus trituberculatus TaxID=210409 RepID=A0A5B7IMP9_PORTR|nr:hypothetical protein [Portunus trituberculatus]